MSVSDLYVENECTACSPSTYSVLWANNILIKIEKIKLHDYFPEWLQLLYPTNGVGEFWLIHVFSTQGLTSLLILALCNPMGTSWCPVVSGVVLFSHYLMSSSFLNPGLLVGSQIPYHCTTREACPVVYMHYILY